MDRQVLASLVLSAAILATAVGVLTDETPLAAEERCDTAAELARDVDGGKAYVCGVVVDAGLPDCDNIRPPEVCAPTWILAKRRLTQSTHVRAPKGQTDGGCLIREPEPGLGGGFKAPRYFGAGNRFPRAWAVGPGCEEVAGVVASKEDTDVDETELIKPSTGGSK